MSKGLSERRMLSIKHINAEGYEDKSKLNTTRYTRTGMGLKSKINRVLKYETGKLMMWHKYRHERLFRLMAAKCGRSHISVRIIENDEVGIPLS